MRRDSVIKQLFRLFGLLMLVPLFILVKVASKSPKAVERVYSETVYPVIRNAVSAVTRLVPFSLAEAIILVLLAVFAIVLIVRIFKLIFLRRHALVRLVSLLITAVMTAATFIVLFYAMWGFNYFRPSVGTKLDLPEREYSSSELEAVCYDLLENAKAKRAEAGVEESSVYKLSVEDIQEGVVEAYAEFGASRPSFKADVPKVKPVILSEQLSKMGISGIYIFLTEEANINVNEPSLYLPVNAAHETAHYLGFAREEDANFLAYLVCTESSNPALAYSGYMHALLHCGNCLAEKDKEAYNKLIAGYSEGMKRDLKIYKENYDQYAGTDIWNASEKTNDAYLKANKQEKGVKSYTEDTALILRYYDSRRFFNRPE